MKHFYLAFWLMLSSVTISAQTTIFLFDWETDDPKKAAIGPNAASINANAVTKLRADNNTKGLAAGAGANKADVDMILTNNPIFNQDGIDLSFDYSADESALTVFSRTNFKMLSNGFNVTYRVTNLDGTCSAPITSNSTTVVRDNNYRNYRFNYDPNSGAAFLSINGANTWTNAGNETPGRALCWTGDGDIKIGLLMDGSGNGKALLDNMRMQEVAFANSLPVELTYFNATPENDRVDFSWQTASESENEYFSVERSGKNADWTEIARREGLGNSNEIYVYEATDADPLPGVNYYRLKQVDFDGRYGYSAIKSITMAVGRDEPLVYPNPTTDFVYLPGNLMETPSITLHDQQGRLLPVMAEVSATGYRLDLRGLVAGSYYINYDGEVSMVVKR